MSKGIYFYPAWNEKFITWENLGISEEAWDGMTEEERQDVLYEVALEFDLIKMDYDKRKEQSGGV